MKHAEQKDAIDTPVESLFLDTFNENKQNVEWLQKTKENYGDRVDNLAYPLVIERIINALTVRGRSDEIFSMMDKYLEMYDEYSLKNIRCIPLKNEETLINAWPMYLYGYDKYGHPVFYDDLVSLNLPKVVKIFADVANDLEDTNSNGDTETDELIKKDQHKEMLDLCRQFRLKFYAKMSYIKQLQSKKYDTTIFKHILVMDLANFSYLQIASNFSLFSEIAKAVLTNEQMLYPETLYKLYLINCPWSFTFCWKILSTVIDEKTLTKIKLLGADYLKEMLIDINIDQIPKKYGGKGMWKIKLGTMCDMNVIDENIVNENADETKCEQ
eukprot:416395_1